MPVKGLQLLGFVAVAAFSTASTAQEQPRGMLGDFDLKSIILSPTPLGPPTRLEPPPTAEKRAVRKPVAEKPAAPPRIAVPKPTAPKRQATSNRPRQKPAATARKPKRNPVESYARDPRRQTWPCAGDGICAWKQPR